MRDEEIVTLNNAIDSLSKYIRSIPKESADAKSSQLLMVYIEISVKDLIEENIKLQTAIDNVRSIVL